MPRTQKRWLADQGMPDGQIFIQFGIGDVTSGTGAVWTRSGSGLLGLSLPTAATAYVLDKPSSYVMGRTGMQDDLQEQFGHGTGYATLTGAQGLASPPAIFTTPAGVSGPPPFTGLSQFTPVTSPRPKGLAINSISAVYTIGGAAASVNTLGITQTVFANNTAPAVTTILATTNISTAVQAQPYVTKLTLNTPYLTTLNAEYVLEWNLTTGAATGTAFIYGLIFGVTFNYQ